MIDPSVDADGLYRIARTPHVLDDASLMALGEHPNAYPELRAWAFSQLNQDLDATRMAAPPPPEERPKRAPKRRPVPKQRAERVRTPASTFTNARRRRGAKRQRMWLVAAAAGLFVVGSGVVATVVLLGQNGDGADSNGADPVGPHGAPAPAPAGSVEPAPKPDESEDAGSPQSAPQAPLRTAGEGFDCVAVGTKVTCTGTNSKGELGLPSETEGGSTTITLDDAVVELVAGMRFACATDGTGVTCWGNNQWRQTGQEPGSSTKPAQVAALKDKPVESLWAGESHVCAATGDEVWCWGSNNVGQIGVGEPGDPMEPTKVNFGKNVPVIELYGNRFTTCAVRETYDEPWCWGSNLDGVIAPDNDADVLGPTPRRG